MLYIQHVYTAYIRLAKHTYVSDKALALLMKDIFQGNFIMISGNVDINQGRSEGTLSVALEVLIIKSEKDFINLFIFNCLTSNKFLQLQLFDVKFLFSEEHIFRKQKETVAYGRASLVSGFQFTQENVVLLS